MSSSGQMSLCCTIELNCSGMSARLAGASVTRDCTLEICEPSYVPGAAKPFLFLQSTARWGPWGTWQYRSSPLREARLGPRASTGAHLGREVRSGAEEHAIASELSSREGRVRSHVTCGSAGAHLGGEVRSGGEKHVVVPELNSARRRGSGPQDTWQHQSQPR
jgi:hypothetical protein